MKALCAVAEIVCHRSALPLGRCFKGVDRGDRSVSKLLLFKDLDNTLIGDDIVGNARKELLQWHQDNLEDDRYLAQAQYAAGIIEGLKYFEIMHE